MKNKPTRHKETNTFKFKRFADRIAEIDVDVFHRVAHQNEENDADEESLESNFYKTLVKWNDLNLTEGYKSFKNEVKRVVTLPQLINHKEEVVASLTKYLEMKNIAFLQPILDMVVATAKDLQIDFYEYFPQFLTLIIDLLNMKDPEIIEYAFTTLAYLFKFLWRYLIKNIDKTFKLLLPLLVDSKPPYINNFAAESFAFVARKVRDREAFLKLLFTTLEETPNGVVGCGKLLFEVIAGTSGQFHSCAESMLNLYLNALNNDSVDKKLAFDVLHEVFTCIKTQINFKYNQVFWEVFVKRLDDILLATGSNEKQNETFLALIRLIIPVINYKHGRVLQNPPVLITRIIKGISVYETQNDNILIEIIDLSASILLAEGIKLSQETCNGLVSKLMSISKRNMLIYAIRKLINHPSFETLVLPMALQRSILREEFTDEELNLFTQIITTRAPPSLNGYEMNSWRRLNLDLRTFSVKTRGFLKDKLESWKHEDYETNLINENSLKVIVLLPHIIPMNEDLIKELKNIFISVYENLIDENCKSEISRRSFAFLLILQTIVRVMNEKTLEEFLEECKIDFLKLIERYYNDQSILNSLDLFYTHISRSEYKKKHLNQETFDKLYENSVKQLGSPFSRIRLVVCHLYSLFDNVEEIFLTRKGEDSNVLKHLFMAENVQVSVQTYRDRLIHLQALSFGTRAVMNLDPKYYDCSLRFLLGNLYINFSLLWDPVIKAIASYADERCPQFWPILIEELKQDNGELHINYITNIYNTFECNILQNLSKKLEINDKPDFNNYKYLLWKCLSEFPGFCESRNRDFTVLFIDFIERNYFKANSDAIKAYSIEKRQEINDSLIEKAEESEEEEEEEEDEENNEEEDKTKEKVSKEKSMKNSKNQKLKKTGKPSTFKLLLAQLKLFSMMQNPKVLYKESELNKIYMNLLTFKSPELQKSVLDCIFAYKRKNLSLYKDHLYGLIDEKNLRNELARFKIADDEGTEDTIPAEHRKFLMPILMRIIYAKLVTRGSGRAAGAAGGLARRKIILRFLMGVKEEEMVLFAEMAFKPLERYNISLALNDKIEDLTLLTTSISEKLSLSNVIPPARLRSAVNLLGIVIEEFGAKMSNNLLPKLLAMLVCVFAEIKSILEKSENVLSGFLSTIKELRTSCLGILTRFFAHFETYPWSPSELDAVFNVAVFPWLEKLPSEGIYSPTALLKLFSTWCHHPRYFCLLVKHEDNNKDLLSLPFIMKLLLNERINPAVANAILEMIERLLTLADYESVSEDAMEVDDALPKIPIHPRNVIEVDPNAVLPGSTLNYGSAILFPYVSDILNYIKRKLKKFKMNVNRMETTVLARISELNLDSDSSNVLLSLLLPILVKKASRGESEQTIIDLLTTIANLMKTVPNPEIHVRAILPLLFNISSAPPRRLLLTLLETIANNISDSSGSLSKEIMVKNVDVLKHLNAMDEKWLDQPDYDKRLDSLSEINAMVSGENGKQRYLNVEFGVAVVYNCFYFLHNESDMALKDSSGLCLKALGPKLVEICKDNVSDRKYLIDDTILNLIKDGMKSKNSNVRYESTSFLGVMTMECSDSHPVFHDLYLLTNKDYPDRDFFENLKHPQLYYKVRALLKFCSVSKTLNKPPNTKTLTQFIFPVASFYLCNESFVGKNSIVDAAIETVGTVCRLLPWYHYSLILKIYLSKLRTQSEFRKQIVRAIVAILDAFHYDLSKLKAVNESLVEEKEEIQNIQNLSELEKDQKEEGQDLERSNNVEIKLKQEKVDSTELIESSVEKKEKDDQDDEEADRQNKITPEELLEDELAQEIENEKEIQEESEQSDDKEAELKVDELIMEKQTILSQSDAKKLVFEITHTFLPQLHRSILARTQHEMSHKINRKQHGIDKEEEELMRVPIALALVKLLQKLPDNLIERNLPGIFMKICTFLKSRLDSVRRATREILQKIMITLGPNYLHHLLKETNTLLTKGFQIHVLAYTIQAVLTSLKPVLTPTHMNDNLQSILQICKVDLFGLSAEEKEVTAITKNISEAKSTKSFDIFHILSQYINESCLVDLIQPLNDVLNETRSHKVVRKVTECLRHTVLGLADNTFIQIDKMLIFLYGIVSKSIPSLNPNKKNEEENKKPLKSLIEKPDCYIIPPEPKSRTGIKASAKTTGSTNDHIMLEFSLKLLHILLKRERVAGEAFKPYLNPFVSILSDCLTSQHVKLSTLSLQCLNWVLKMDLEAVHANIKDICTLIFKILHKYGVAGLGKGDNFDLVMASFKTMSVIIRDLKDFEMSYDEVKVLVLYAEQDLHDYEKQATAFNLLRAIIGRRLNVFQIHRVMKKVAALSITSDSENVRQQCRAVFYQFFMEYPLGDKLDKHLNFYLTQMGYELQTGRLSALEMIQSIIFGFPSTVLVEKSEILFIMISARLVNDDDPTCRKHAAQCIKQLITRVPYNQRSKLFNIVLAWFQDSIIMHRRLAAQVCGIFVTTEEADFEKRLESVLPFIVQQFKNDDDDDDEQKNEDEPGKFVRRKKKRKRENKMKDVSIEDKERIKDHHAFQVLQLTLKISSKCPAFLDSTKYPDSIQFIAQRSQEYLAHPHLWVRLAAVQQLGFILAKIDENKLSKLFKAIEMETNTTEEPSKEEEDGKEVKGYIYSSPLKTLKSLSLDLIAQLQPGIEVEEFFDQVVSNLVSISRIIQRLTWKQTSPREGDEERIYSGISNFWMMKWLRKCINIEIVQNSKSINVRTAVFKWIAGVVTKIPKTFLEDIFSQMMSPLVREMMITVEPDSPLQQLAKQVAKMIKSKVGDKEYVELLMKIQQKIDIRKAERKKSQTQRVIVDPEYAAKKKIIRQQRKKEAKKRKNSQIRGKKFGVKKRKTEVDSDLI